MLFCWLKWCFKIFGMRPKIRQPGGGFIGGFRNFSEFWGGFGMVPSSGEIAFIELYAGKDGIMLDVGANLGCMALVLSKCRPLLEAHAFEPSPESYERLKENLRSNGCDSVNAHQLALGRSENSLEFINDPESPATNRFLRSGEASGGAPVINVQVTTLDRFLDINQIRQVAFLKIDVEGFEADVFRGAQRLLRECRCHAGLVELCPGNLSRVGASIDDLLKVVEESGYSLFHIQNDGSLGMLVTLETATKVVLENVALIPR